jgi:hypothetical protein
MDKYLKKTKLQDELRIQIKEAEIKRDMLKKEKKEQILTNGGPNITDKQ